MTTSTLCLTEKDIQDAAMRYTKHFPSIKSDQTPAQYAHSVVLDALTRFVLDEGGKITTADATPA